MCQYVVLDLEMCKIFSRESKKRLGRSSELIQIGAVLLDGSLNVTGSFMTYVHPEYGKLDDHIIKLTGITNRDIETAPSSEEALYQFFKWIPEDAKIVSWSRNDLYQIQAEIQGKDIDIPEFERISAEWVDSQEMFGEKMNSGACYKLSEALNISGIVYLDGEHDALVDAKNTAMLFKKMKTEPVLQISPYLMENTERFVTNPFASLLQKVAIA